AINSFSISKKEYAPWVEARFQEIKKGNIKHLIVDVQQNGGGTEGNENLLASYLIKEAFQKYAFVSMLKEPYLRIQDDPDLVEDGYQLKGKKGQRGAFTLQSNYYSNLGYKAPDPDLMYDGKMYLLISGITFSGGAEFASMIRMQNRAVIVGEESGGVYEGNVSGYNSSVKLKHSKIEVDIPIVHFRMNVKPNPQSRGVMPDYTVPQTASDFWQERNTKKAFVLEELLGIKD
ncbi:MAG: S41 family peptidase, partial [Bacteroidota bacterium]